MISESFDAFVCDMDGVLYRGKTPVPGAIENVKRLRADGTRFLFCTNNAVPTVSQYLEKLASLGLDIDADELLTSAMVAADILGGRGMAGQTAYVVGGDGIREELGRVGIEVVPRDRATDVDLVVVGSDHTFDYRQMRIAANAVRSGAAFIGTNADPSYPVEGGIAPGAGAIIASIEVASGGRAEVMGKPHAPMMEAAAGRLSGCRAIAAIGDQPKTDLEGARSQGWGTILVLTGVIDEAASRALDPPPDHILRSIAELE
jgi:HAD superfamily hydrolase (TIGR01450 family)